MVIISAMNPSIDAYVDVMSTTRDLPFWYGFPAVFNPPLGVRICVASWDSMCINIFPLVYCFLGILPLFWQSYILLVRVLCERVTTGRERLSYLLMPSKLNNGVECFCAFQSRCDVAQESHDTRVVLWRSLGWYGQVDIVPPEEPYACLFVCAKR